MKHTPQNPTKNDLRNFGLMMGIVIPILFGLLLPWLFSRPMPRWPWIVAAPFLFLALLYPFALKIVYKIWLKVGEVLGFINTRIILGILFFLVFTPIGLVMRLFRKNALSKKFSHTSAKTSYRVKSDASATHSLERPF